MTWPTELTVSVVSGVLVVLIATLGRALWVQRRIPSALPRRVRRETYVGTLRKLSQSVDVRTLHVPTRGGAELLERGIEVRVARSGS